MFFLNLTKPESQIWNNNLSVLKVYPRLENYYLVLTWRYYFIRNYLLNVV